jgi:regulator of sigma E protease
MTALLVIGILVLLIVIHELGHFLVAKWTGVRVEEFGIGYPPRAFTFGVWNKTEYTLNWLPFGGFVRLYGDEGHAEHGRGSMADAPRYVQALILIAGVAANALLAWVLFAGAFMIGVPTLVQSAQAGEETRLFVSDIVPGSPVSGSGMIQGDEIKMVIDGSGHRVEPLTPEAMLDFIKDRGGKEITITYQHGDAIRTASVIPANAVVPGAEGRPALGVGLALVANRTLSLPDALYESFFVTRDAFVSTAQSLWMILTGAFTGTADLSQIVGPVGLVSVVHLASENGFGNVVKLAAFISVNLVIINLFPIPALDGGRLLILGVEALRKKRTSKLAVQLLNGLSIVFVIVLMVVVTYNDIGRLIS